MNAKKKIPFAPAPNGQQFAKSGRSLPVARKTVSLLSVRFPILYENLIFGGTASMV